MKLGIYFLYATTKTTENETNVRKFIYNLERHLNNHFIEVDETTWTTTDANFILIGTGGTEKQFLELTLKVPGPYFLLTHDNYNSLPAAMEIITYLNQQNKVGFIVHGTNESISERIHALTIYNQVRNRLIGNRLGIIGEPSDWLIASNPDYEKIMKTFGIDFIRIPLEEVSLAIIENTNLVDPIPTELVKLAKSNQINLIELEKAWQVYLALKKLVRRYRLDGLTIRCFDLITTCQVTSCLALALLNQEGITAGCEGDIPSLVSMHFIRKFINQSGFQANIARINPQTNRVIFAHCTIPLDMVNQYQLTTHFESQSSVAIKGEVLPGKVTIFKISPDLSTYYARNAYINCNLNDSNLCRTQIEIQVTTADIEYFFYRILGNHHIIIQGHHQKDIDKFFSRFVGINKQ